jgi:D-xylose transport system substrate-binding protein
VDAVIAENDSLAGGVINTLSEYHLVPNVPVVGMDADLAACQRVVEGQQLMTVYKPIKLLAVAAADFAVKMANGEDIGVTGKISDGKYNVPYYSIIPEAVTKDNMVDAVINDGFHKMSDVYLNVPKDQWPPN